MTANINPEHPHRKTVRKAIGFNEWAYDNLIHKYYVTWCEEIAIIFYHNDRDLIQNESLFSWYREQWQHHVERAMILDYGRYMQKNLPNTKSFYYKQLCEYAEYLEHFYPAVLIPKKKYGCRITSAPKVMYNLNYN